MKIHGATALAQTRGGPNRFRDEGLRMRDRRQQVLSAGKARGDGGRETRNPNRVY